MALDLLREDLAKLVEHDRLVDHAADGSTLRIPRRPEVPSVGSFPGPLAHDERPEAFFHGSIAHIEGGMGADRRDANSVRIVSLEDLHDRLAVDHPAPMSAPCSKRLSSFGPLEEWRTSLSLGAVR